MFNVVAWLFLTKCTIWNAFAIPSTGEWHVWAGTAIRFDAGPHVALSWDDEVFWWCAGWFDRQDEDDEFERDAWGVEGRIGGRGLLKRGVGTGSGS